MLLLILQARCAGGVETPASDQARVGDRGDPAQVLIEGTQTFTEGDIRRALQTDLDYLVASDPEATLAECLAALENRVRAGYRDSGFRDVVVQTRFDVSAGRVGAKVTEGLRYRCGALEVTGLKSIPAAQFTRRFTEKLAPPDQHTVSAPGLWHTGAPVSFTPESLANYSTAASNTFAALGRFAPVFKVEVRPQRATNDAALVVIVEDEGPAAVLRDIALVGNNKNRREDVIAFLGLAKGKPITQDLIDEKARALTQSARFADCSITPIRISPKGQVSLRIQVAETSRLPPLAQPLSREEKTFLRLREWLMAWESHREDLAIDWSLPTAQSTGPKRIEAIVAPSGGIAARVLGDSPGQEGLQDLYALVIQTDTLRLFTQVHERKLCFPLPPGYSGILFVKLGACSECPSGFNLTLGAGLSPGQTNTGWQVRLDLLPAAFADLLHRPGTEATWQGNVLTVQTEGMLVRVDEGTGRLLELNAMAIKSGSSAGAPSAYGLAVRFRSGVFAKTVEEIAAHTSSYPDAYHGQRALGSALGFIAAELVRAEPLWTPAPGNPRAEPPGALASALEKLLTSSFLDPLGRVLAGAEARAGNPEFTIPSKPVENQNAAEQVFQQVAVWCAGHAQELAPAGSWLQSLLREAALGFNSKTNHTAAALGRLAGDEDLGPLGGYVALHLALPLHQDSWRRFRYLSFKRLGTEDFRRDYQMLLNSESVITRCLANLVRELGTLTEPEVNSMAELLPPHGAELVRDLAASARKAKDLPVTDAMGPALDRWWETTARRQVEADLRFHTQPSGRARSQE